MQQFDANLWKTLIEAIRADDGQRIDELHASIGLGDVVKASDPEDANGKTPLMWAYWMGSPSAASAVLRAGAVYAQLDAKGNSARWYAERLGCGVSAERMDVAIDANVRRLSMESVITRARAADEASTPPDGAHPIQSRRSRRPPI